MSKTVLLKIETDNELFTDISNGKYRIKAKAIDDKIRLNVTESMFKKIAPGKYRFNTSSYKPYTCFKIKLSESDKPLKTGDSYRLAQEGRCYTLITYDNGDAEREKLAEKLRKAYEIFSDIPFTDKEFEKLIGYNEYHPAFLVHAYPILYENVIRKDLLQIVSPTFNKVFGVCDLCGKKCLYHNHVSDNGRIYHRDCYPEVEEVEEEL